MYSFRNLFQDIVCLLLNKVLQNSTAKFEKTEMGNHRPYVYITIDMILRVLFARDQMKWYLLIEITVRSPADANTASQYGTIML